MKVTGYDPAAQIVQTDNGSIPLSSLAPQVRAKVLQRFAAPPDLPLAAKQSDPLLDTLVRVGNLLAMATGWNLIIAAIVSGAERLSVFLLFIAGVLVIGFATVARLLRQLAKPNTAPPITRTRLLIDAGCVVVLVVIVATAIVLGLNLEIRS